MNDDQIPAPPRARRSQIDSLAPAGTGTKRPIRLRPVSRRSVGLAGFAATALAAVMTATGWDLVAGEPATASMANQAHTAPATGGRPADLRECPQLRRNQRDPVNGMNCVQALQLTLKTHGYPAQAVTGRFLSQTETNVLDLQRRHKIQPVSGIVGPQTRAVLTAAPADPTQPPLRSTTRGDYSGNPRFTDNAYQVYLRRSTTREYARFLQRHPVPSSAVSSALITGACQVIKISRPVKFLCGIIGRHTADDLADQLKEAARQGACLRVSVGILYDDKGLHLLRARPDNTWRCTD